MSSLLPTPEPPDPVEGALGHFEHSNWVKASLKALDQGTVHKDGSVPISGDTKITGDLVVNRASDEYAYLFLDGDERRSVVGRKANGTSWRWRITLGDETPETGLNNSGALFKLFAYQDDGNRLEAMSADRNTALLTVAGDPTAAKGIATKQYVDAAIPVGTIIMFGGSTVPASMQTMWQACDGSATVPGSALANIVGANVPDLRGLFVVGAGLNADASTGAVTNYPVGKGSKLGQESVVLTQAQTPVKSHVHPIDHNHAAVQSGAGTSHSHTINHDHGSVNTGNNTHSHTLQIREGTGTGDGYYQDTNPTDSGTVKTLAGSKTSDYTHAHSVDLPSFSGSSGAEAAHTHSVDLPNFVGNSGAGADAAATGHENRPPYYAMIYLIKKV